MASSSSNPPEDRNPEVAISEVNAAASEYRPAATPVTTAAAPVVLPAADYRAPTPTSFHDHISEFAADVAGALSPFGDDVEFPLPAERLSYRHPGPANRPALAGD